MFGIKNTTTPASLKAKIDSALSVFLKTISDLTEVNQRAESQIATNKSEIGELEDQIHDKEIENNELVGLIINNTTMIEKMKEFTF